MKTVNFMSLLFFVASKAVGSVNPKETNSNLRGDVDLLDEDINASIAGLRNENRGLRKKNGRNTRWLESHNSLREKYHKQYGTTYVPLKWSPGLKKQAKDWADKMVETCVIKAPKTVYGSTVSGKQGTTELRTTDEILAMWESKLDLGWNENAAFTQVLWRGTHYVGCADSISTNMTSTGGKKCSFSVCYYARPGNCGMKSAQDWKVPMLADTSACTPACPPEDCW